MENKNKLIITLIGKTSAGKDSLMNTLLRDRDVQLHQAISHTTRPMRTNEVDGSDYYFINDVEFDELSLDGEFIETTSYYIESEKVLYRYGLSKKEIEENEIVITIVNPHGYKALLHSEYGKNVVAFQIIRDDRLRAISYLERDEDANVYELQDRWHRDDEDFEGLLTDYVIYNDSYVSAYEELKALVLDEINGVE